MRFKPLALGLTSGILWGLAVMLGTWWLLITGSGGKTMIVLKNFYFGYSFSYLGGIIGLVWGFADGLLCGIIFALLYNALAKDKAPAAPPPAAQP